MAKQVKLQLGTNIVYPQTITDAIVDVNHKMKLSDIIADLERKIAILTSIISVDDANNNGVADGEDRISNIENEMIHAISDETLTIGSITQD